MRKEAATIEHREAGQTMAEYGVVLAVITVTIMATLLVLSGAINGALNDVIGVLNGGPAAPAA
jgi:Flp pilus assembly pilin Flp